ncbi:MAG TPA: DUF1587 domain-containing protein, partial [Gemmataceae bacterium]|nr:DUF1587 domain-containing protein [Gemmataceae bacterium]
MSQPALARAALSWLCALPLLVCQSPIALADDKVFKDKAQPFFTQFCQECLTGAKPKGDFRVDQLMPDFDNQESRERWLMVQSRLLAGEMPPKEKLRPPQKDIRALCKWVNGQLEAAAARRAAEGRVVLRRLNRVEYENTMRDLLGINIELKELLPPDTSSHGFDNVGEALHVSSFLMERYLEAADAALNVAIANGPQPPLVKKRYSLKDERIVKIDTERVYRALDDTLIMFSSSHWNSITVGQFYPSDRGKYRVRISAFGVQSSGKPVSFRIDVGPMLMGTINHLVDYYDVPPDKPTLVEFVDHFEARNHLRISPYGLATAQTVSKVGAEKYEGPGLAVQWVEVEGPLYDHWPPESHRRIFANLPQALVADRNYNQRVEVVSKDPQADAERILREFARRAFRRMVTDADIKPFLDLVKEKLATKQSFEQAVRVGLKAVLVSPDFLFLREKPRRLDDFALASRLSYFLWSTMPDEELLTLAEKKSLEEPETLRRQVERMLNSPKAQAFTENFVGQWLNLR